MLQPPMHHRGRSRDVSPVALARLASEERRYKTMPRQRPCHQSQRAERLKACEKLWEDEKYRLHDERRRALERREHHAEQERARADRHRATTVPVSTVIVSPPSKREQDPFQYTFMSPPPRSPKSIKKTSQNRSVSFKEVIHAMNGKLFPLDPAEDARRIAGLPITNTSPHKRKASVRAELLDSLLQVVEWEQDERRSAKGKAPLKSHDPPTAVSAVSLSSSRSSSWLSFGSWRSTATDITTPDSALLCVIPTLIDHRDHARADVVHIALEEGPLCTDATQDEPTGDTPHSPPPLSLRGTLVRRVTRSVATIVGAARGLQSAYISATLFAAGHPSDSFPHHHRPSRCQRHPRRQGYRALAKDVQRFINPTPSISQPCEPVLFIPLLSATAGIPNPPLPRDVVLFPSPLRPRTPPSALAYRMRPIANPAVLRLKALQNIMDARGKEWEGRGREGGLGCGKERMLGIAFEGRGRSGLGCEVRFVVA